MSTLLFTDAGTRAAAKARFDELPMPTRLNEEFRFSNLKALDLTPFAENTPLFAGDHDRILKGSAGLAEAAGKAVFANDTLLSQEHLSRELAEKGVIWEPLAAASKAHPALFENHFMAHGAPLGSAKFAALHAARVQTGTFLYVPDGVEIALPIESFHWLSGDKTAVFPHTLLIAGAGSKVTLVDYFEGAEPDTAGLAIGFNDLYAGEGAQVTYVNVQNWNTATLAIQVNNTTVGANATVKSLNVNLGGRYARTESLSRLTGEGGRSDMLAVTAATGSQEFDQRTFQDHLAPGAYSDLLYKNALDGAARTIFAGMIKVEQGAHRTDAYQKVRNLLLSEDAEANSMPGLEILADEVRCSHGATSATIEPEQLFYMLARGIARPMAQRLIVHGFLQEAVDRIGNEALAAHLGELVGAKFGA